MRMTTLTTSVHPVVEVLAVSMRQEKDKRYTDWTVNSETTQNQYGQYIKSSKESTKKLIELINQGLRIQGQYTKINCMSVYEQ